jgi:hypothetical protein
MVSRQTEKKNNIRNNKERDRNYNMNVRYIIIKLKWLNIC